MPSAEGRAANNRGCSSTIYVCMCLCVSMCVGYIDMSQRLQNLQLYLCVSSLEAVAGTATAAGAKPARDSGQLRSAASLCVPFSCLTTFCDAWRWRRRSAVRVLLSTSFLIVWPVARCLCSPNYFACYLIYAYAGCNYVLVSFSVSCCCFCQQHSGYSCCCCLCFRCRRWS